MNDDKERNTAIDVELGNGDSDSTGPGYQNHEQEETDNVSTDELKKQAGELFKAAGELAGSFGRFAVKKGAQLKEKLEDEEFQEKTRESVKTASESASKFAEKATAKVTEAARSIENAIDSIDDKINIPADSEAEHIEESTWQNPTSSKESIDTTIEVETGEEVEFDVNQPKKGLAKVIDQKKRERAQKKAEKERIKKEEERKKKQEEKTMWIIYAIVMVALFAGMGIMTHTAGSRHEGEIHPPISSVDISGLNYEDVAKEFEEAGFTDISTMKKEDLVVGWLSSDGEVEKVTIDDAEDFSTSTWCDPTDKVIVYYHTFPEDVQAVEEVKEEADEALAEDADTDLLASFIGMTCAEADPQIIEAGYTPTYLAANTRDDMTISIQDDEELAKTFKISEIDGVIDKTVYYKVKSQEMEEQEKHTDEIESKMPDYTAMSIVQLYGDTQLYNFKLKYITCKAQVSGNGWDVYGQCTFTDIYGNKYKGECVAHVNADTQAVESFEVR